MLQERTADCLGAMRHYETVLPNIPEAIIAERIGIWVNDSLWPKRVNSNAFENLQDTGVLPLEVRKSA
jgi:hypothetical protein